MSDPNGPPADPTPSSDRPAPGGCTPEYRRQHLPPVPLDELRPRRTLPLDAELAAAMRLVPVALMESRFAGEAWLPSDPGQMVIEYPAWLAFAEERRLARNAAEWAVYRLAEGGLIEVVWPLTDQMRPRDGQGESDAAQAARYRGGRAPTVGDWDLFEDGRRLQLRSTPGLWDFYRNGTTPPASDAPAGGPSPGSDFLARRAREKAEGRDRDERDREECERLYLRPLRELRPEWDAAWAELWDRLTPVWRPWVDRAYPAGEPDVVAVAAALKRVAAVIDRRDAIPEWFLSRLSYPVAPNTARSRLARVAEYAEHFTTEAPVVAAALVAFALDHPADAVAARIRDVLADPDWRPAVGWMGFIPACLWPTSTFPEPPMPADDPEWPDGRGVYVGDCRRLEHLLFGRFTGPLPDDLFPQWRCRMENIAADTTTHPEQEPSEQPTESVGQAEDTNDESEPADDKLTPPDWGGLGYARQMILKALAQETGRRDGRWVAGRAGYSYGTFRHYAAELRGWGYIDRTKDGYAITPDGRALLPPKAV